MNFFKRNKILAVVYFGLFVLVLSVCLENIQERPKTFNGEYSVELKTNSANDELTDVYLNDSKTGVSVFFRTVSNVFRDEYGIAKFVNNNLYILERFGVDSRHNFSDDWTDKLVKYQSTGTGQTLFEARGVEFIVSPDGQRIAVHYGGVSSSSEQAILFIDTQGKVIKEFGISDFRSLAEEDELTLLFWDNETLWLSANMMTSVNSIYSISPDGALTSYNNSGLPFAHTEFSIRPSLKRLVFDDFPTPITVEDSKIVQHVTIYVYDLLSGKKTKLASLSTNLPLAPVWLDDSTVEYGDAKGNRVKLAIK